MGPDQLLFFEQQVFFDKGREIMEQQVFCIWLVIEAATEKV